MRRSKLLKADVFNVNVPNGLNFKSLVKEACKDIWNRKRNFYIKTFLKIKLEVIILRFSKPIIIDFWLIRQITFIVNNHSWQVKSIYFGIPISFPIVSMIFSIGSLAMGFVAFGRCCLRKCRKESENSEWNVWMVRSISLLYQIVR